ncbi:aldo/keto reductase [Propioniferax innocua]|uniref:Aryl-alcohol dehydrogenase-like predicted oxidoreductase n=1 Tax=Propioniferax innocua TaxID=1753 RepID=A0A542ZRM8_9ACTN|nr:aldo/keto reductase [Propioniferax innocua]TQL62956.1 aryl-alcohol dehydrogenase-like predicted oxidoreductase [Propioniferax innocua]
MCATEPMPTRRLGPFEVSAIGLGAMPLSMGRDPQPTQEQAIATINAALDAGVTFIDTADIYAPSHTEMGHNERLVAAALAQRQKSGPPVVVGTKGGITRSTARGWGRNGSIEYLRRACEASCEALGVDHIDLYQWHRPDHHRAWVEGIEALATLHQEGLITAVGISNASSEQIELAIDMLGTRSSGGLASVQNEFSPAHPWSRHELELCAEHQVAFLPWSPLGGIRRAGGVDQHAPVLTEIAAAHRVSPQQVTLAWELALGDHVIPIPGAGRPASIIDSAAAATLRLTKAEVDALDEAIGGHRA